MIEENYDEWEGKTVSAESYNEALIECEEKEEIISRLKEDLEFYKEKIHNLNYLIFEMDKELKRMDKIVKEYKENS